MTLRSLCVAALAAGALVAPPAHAADSTYEGGCGYETVKSLPASVDEPGVYTGVVYFAVVLESGSPGAVVEAEVSCELRVDGVVQDRLGPVHVTGAGVAAGELTFRAYDLWDDVWVCDVITFSDGSPPVDDCGSKTAICDTFCMAKRMTDPTVHAVEADACARLGAQAPGVPGVVDVMPGGDVYVGGVWAFDCAPYGPYDAPAPDTKAEYADCWSAADAERPPVSLGRDRGYTYVAELALTAVVTSESRPVAEASVRCEIRVNGVPEATLGPVHVVGAGGTVGVVEYAVSPTDDVQTCVVVEFVDGSPPYDLCFQETSHCDPRCTAGEADPYVRPLEAATCAALAAQSPGVPGVTDITSDGDVYLGGVWTFDCPPYGPYQP